MRVAGPVLALALVLAPAVPGAEGAPPDPKLTKVATGLNMPVDFAFAPDGAVYFVELQAGKIRVLRGWKLDPNPVGSVKVTTGGERGLFGLAIDPEYARTGAVYVSYSYESKGQEAKRVSRFAGGKEQVILDKLPAAIMHNGGRLLFAPDGTLFVTQGDSVPYGEGKSAAKVAQAKDRLNGKILHVTRDGKPVPGNPWGDASPVWTSGHRNVYGIARAPDGRLFVTENGNEKMDEINLLAPGKDYGWPTCEGPCNPPRDGLVDPVWKFDKTVGLTGATWWRGSLVYGEFNRGYVHRLQQGADGKWTDTLLHRYTGSPPRVLDVEAGPDGALYYSTWDSIYRLEFPPEPTTPASPTGPSPSTPAPTPTPTSTPSGWTPTPSPRTTPATPSPSPTSGDPPPDGTRTPASFLPGALSDASLEGIALLSAVAAAGAALFWRRRR